MCIRKALAARLVNATRTLVFLFGWTEVVVSPQLLPQLLGQAQRNANRVYAQRKRQREKGCLEQEGGEEDAGRHTPQRRRWRATPTGSFRRAIPRSCSPPAHALPSTEENGRERGAGAEDGHADQLR